MWVSDLGTCFVPPPSWWPVETLEKEERQLPFLPRAKIPHQMPDYTSTSPRPFISATLAGKRKDRP